MLYICLTPKEQNENTYLIKLLGADVPENQICIEKISNQYSKYPSFRQLLKKPSPEDMLFPVGLNHKGRTSRK